MTTVTRFAPTCSGQLHLGSLWNAMLNWLYAKHKSGRFNVRVDGHIIRGTRITDRESILADLETFGLEWDELVLQSDRLQEHKDAFRQLVDDNPDAFYECNCSTSDIARRNMFPPHRQMYKLLRPEKYPRPCRLVKIQSYDSQNQPIQAKSIMASHESRDHPADVLITDEGSWSGPFWSNTDIGNINSPDMTTLVMELDEQFVCGLEMTFREYPFLDYQVHVWHEDKWQCVARVNKPVEYFEEVIKHKRYAQCCPERVNFAPVKTDRIKIDITRLPLPLDRPYHYDYHCKELNQKLDWSDEKTVIRCHYREDVYLNYLDFVTKERIPDRRIAIDTAAWFDFKPDLVFSSPYDDKKMGATHLIRGRDIYPFFFMESNITHLLGYKPLQTFHGMVLDEHGVKYSKFIKSRAVSSYLEEGVSPGQILGYLAWKGGITNEYPGEVKLEDLLPFDIHKLPKNDFIINETEMMEFLT